jgi:uncharacterized protein YkwD
VRASLRNLGFAAACALGAASICAPGTARAAEPPAADALAADATQLINALRQSLPGCRDDAAAGLVRVSQRHATPPRARPVLQWNATLAAVAERHARAMADELFFDHVDPQGRDVGKRAQAAGYRWRVVGENIAAGQETLDDALRAWAASEGHCRNLLDARYAEFGLARVVGGREGDPYGVYWALVMARPAALPLAASLD